MGRVEFRQSVILIPLLLVWLTLITLTVKAQPPTPALNCISVEDDGSLSVSWSIPAGTFDGFRLFYKKVNDPLSNSIDFTNVTNSTVLSVPDGQTTGYEVYLVTFNFGPPLQTSAESNHLRSMMLTVSNAGAGNGIARLDWNRIQAGTNGVFFVFRKELSGTFSQIAQTNNNFYEDTITSPYCKIGAAGTDLFYRVEFSSGSCVANSSTSSGNFFDDNVPEDPTLSFVTINATGLAEVNWTHSPSDDVNGYIVGVQEGLNFIDHFTTGYSNLFIDDKLTLPTYHDPCIDSVIYVVRAQDMCNNQSSGAINYQFPHNTIRLRGETQTLCERKATLIWNAYKNMQPPVSEYKVLRTRNGSAPVEIATIAATAATQYTFIDDELLTPGDVYTYKILTNNGDNSKISGSCEIQLVPDPEPFSLFELDYVSVVDNDHVEIFINSDPPYLISDIEVWRSAIDGSSVERLFNKPWEVTSPDTIADATALVNETSYYYSIVALDACGFELEASNVARSVFLEISDIGNDEYRLNWNAYEDWGSNLLEYAVYRIADGVIEAGFPVTVPPGVLVFNDFAGDLTANRTTYYVEAVRNDEITSRSNEVLLPADAVVTIPNAFRPDGISPVFKPRLKNIEPGSYLFTIYNRWGQLIFETSNTSEGWNGLVDGQPASTDLYAWIITFKDLPGKKVVKKGSVMLVR
jgi:gliding motility-associated-like protein